MLQRVALAEDEKNIYMLQMSESFFAEISKMCMIMELRCLHLLHTSLRLSLSLFQHSPLLTPARFFSFLLDAGSFLLARPLCHIGSGLS